MLKASIAFFKDTIKNDKFSDDLKLFSDNLPKAKCFVLTDAEDTKYSDLDMQKEYYLPFKVTVFDLLPPFDFNSKESWSLYGFEEPKCFGVIYIERDDLSISRFIIVGETKGIPNYYWNNLNAVPNHIYGHTMHFANYEELNKDWSYKAMMAFLNKKEIGHFQIKRSIQFKRKGLAPDFVKKLVILANKKYKDRKSLYNEPIEYLHSWRVMGHWRSIDQNKIGKDREGNYRIVGRTWIKNFIKGKGPLIEKERIKYGS